MGNFKNSLEKKLLVSRYNDFGIENYDINRFGDVFNASYARQGVLYGIKKHIKLLIGYKEEQSLKAHTEFILKYNDSLQRIYEQINPAGRKLLIEIIAYRLLGYKKIKLSRNCKKYWKAIALAHSLTNPDDVYDPHFLHFILHKCDLTQIGYDVRLYFTGPGVAVDYILEQYAYKSGNKSIVEVEKGDIVFDLGACWGDTALYFAFKTGESGRVYSFEFIPDNIKLFNLNLSLNPNLKGRIELIRFPVSERSGNIIYFDNNGPGSKIQSEPHERQTEISSTVSIDDIVRKYSIAKVDFIKMDIEGSELCALEGALETIRNFKPKLAISIYHSIDDFVNIPIWILELNLGYKLYLDHFTIHSEETIIFAKV
jgi:FkbM family methyltransferase